MKGKYMKGKSNFLNPQYILNTLPQTPNGRVKTNLSLLRNCMKQPCDNDFVKISTGCFVVEMNCEKSVILKMITSKVIIIFNMLGTLIENISMSNLNSTLIFTMKYGSKLLKDSHICKKPTKP